MSKVKNDAECIYNTLTESDKALISAMNNVFLAIFQGIQQTAIATVNAELKKIKQNKGEDL